MIVVSREDLEDGRPTVPAVKVVAVVVALAGDDSVRKEK